VDIDLIIIIIVSSSSSSAAAAVAVVDHTVQFTGDSRSHTQIRDYGWRQLDWTTACWPAH